MSQRPVWKQHCNIYRGEFVQGERHGHGSFFYANGSQYCGLWKSNKKHGEGIFYHHDGRVFYGLFSNDYIDKQNDALSMNKNQSNSGMDISSNISTQYYLNIQDILLQYLFYDRSSQELRNREDIKEISLQETKELERILLQYHSYLKQSHKDICNRSNKYRMKSQGLIRYLQYDEEILQPLTMIERMMYTTRQLHPCRLYAATLDSVQLFFVEIGLIHPLFMNFSDFKAIFQTMKTSKQCLTNKKRWDYSIQASSRGIEAIKYSKDYHIHDLVQVFMGKRLNQDQGEGGSAVASWISRKDQLEDPRSPVLEHEFIELIIRSILKYEILDYKFHFTKSSNRYISPSKIVYKYLAEKVISDDKHIIDP